MANFVSLGSVTVIINNPNAREIERRVIHFENESEGVRSRHALRTMERSDNDLEGEAGSVLMGSADVRRSIPIKLISERPGALRVGNHPWKKYKAHNTTSEREASVGFGDNGFQHDDFGADHDKPLRIIWNCKINILGRKEETPVHFCDKCALPIKIYGRMIPCKHIFCFGCASLHEQKGDKNCPGCSDGVQRIEQCARGTVFMCSVVPGCKRTYLSQRDLQAHVNHRHVRHAKPFPRPPELSPASLLLPHAAEDRHVMPPEVFGKPGPPPEPRPPLVPPPPVLDLGAVVLAGTVGTAPQPRQPPPGLAVLAPQVPQPQPPQQESYRITTITTPRTSHCNLISVPIQGHDANPQGPAGPPYPEVVPGSATHTHHLDYQTQTPPPPPPPPPHTAHMMLPPSPYAQPPPLGHPTAPHLAYGQPPPPPPPAMVSGQRAPPPPPPYLTQPPPPHHPAAPPMPLHYNPQGPLTPPYTQPTAVGIWVAGPPPQGPPPPRGPPPPPPGSHPPGPAPHDQTHYRAYYQ
uniref:E3 ubiquitin-protein ligase Hakai-like isoform X2 n=1 Tax=Myxine glutinosa TaxID=7769 RepID=UPI00358E6AFC